MLSDLTTIAKRCTRCGIVKNAVQDFPKKSGQCKTCRAAYKRAYHATNAEKVRARRKAYYASNHEKIRASQQAYRAAHHEEIRVYQQAYRAAHQEELRAYFTAHRAANLEKIRVREQQYAAPHREANKTRMRAYYAEHREEVRQKVKAWKAANPKKVRAGNKAWEAANPEKVRARRARRRARENNAPRVERFTVLEIAERDRWVCHLCHKKVTRTTWSIDHLTPLSRGGAHTRDNVALAHVLCNATRGNRDATPVQLRLM
jgi:5-methylcytosine-specific restriction endonuclease McrA